MAGHYKIFLGMAAGVGKTYRMLQEGQAEADTGRDVVIGLVENMRARTPRRWSIAWKWLRAVASSTAGSRSRRWTFPG